jgi:hypothetical protein
MKRDWLVILDETCNLTRTPDFELAGGFLHDHCLQ